VIKTPRAWTALAQLQTLHNVIASGWITDYSIAVDGGANRGDWSDVMAKHFGLVYAFEPQRDMQAHMADRFGNVRNVQLIGAALLDRCVRGRMVFPPKRNASTAAFVDVSGDGDVIGQPLDAFNLPACGLLKLDLEGAEYLALKGAEQTIRKHRPVLIVELCLHGKRYGNTRSQTIGLIQDMGYRAVMDAEPDMVFLPC
jgi:FkbM family methyltransferase